MRLELGPENVIFVHLTLVPFIPTAGELKTKPTQHSVKELLSIGIQPDVLICRSDRQLAADLKAKIALFCNVAEACVISAPDVSNIYEVPMTLAAEGLDEQILRLLRLEAPPRDLSRWLAMLETLEHPAGEVRIGVVGKYVQLEDAYKSLREALGHGGLANRQRVVIEWIEAEDIDSPATAERLLRHVDGILVPGGFGKRGIAGMVHAITYAREKKIPFFGICLGMQCATIEYARQVSHIEHADSTEFDPSTPNRVIYKLRELLGVDEMGGTMRLGAWPCKLEPGSFAAQSLWRNWKFPSAIATATNSIANTKTHSRAPASASPDARRTASTSKLWKLPTTRGSSAASFIPNSNPSRWPRIHSSPRSFEPASKIATAAKAYRQNRA